MQCLHSKMLSRCVGRSKRTKGIQRRGTATTTTEKKVAAVISHDGLPATVETDLGAVGAARVKGNERKDLLTGNFGVYFQNQVAKYSSQEFIVAPEQNIRWNWKETNEQVNAFIRGLRKRGFVRGDSLGIWLPTVVESLIAQLACAKMGLIPVVFPENNQRREALYVITSSNMKGILIDNRPHAVKLIHDFVPSLSEGIVSSKFVPSLQYVFLASQEKITGMENYSDVLTEGSSYDEVNISVIPKDYFGVYYTSARTSVPKGAVYTNFHALNSAWLAGEQYSLGPQSTLCNNAPFCQYFGSMIGAFAAMARGSKLVIPSKHFSAEKTLKAIEAEKCDTLLGFPQEYHQMALHPNFDSTNLTSLQHGIMGGFSFKREVGEDIHKKFNFKKFSNIYITAETAVPVFRCTENDPYDYRVGASVGKIQDTFEAVIADADRQVLGLNQLGELYVRGPMLMRQYLADVNRTGNSIIEFSGWFRTGDAAYMTPQGHVTIVGKASEIIHRGGLEVFPEDIEELVESHPSVEMAQAIGLRDPKSGQEPLVYVVLKPDAPAVTDSDLRKYCQQNSRGLPVADLFRFIDSLPVSATGKKQRHKVVEYHAKFFSFDRFEYEMGIIPD